MTDRVTPGGAVPGPLDGATVGEGPPDRRGEGSAPSHPESTPPVPHLDWVDFEVSDAPPAAGAPGPGGEPVRDEWGEREPASAARSSVGSVAEEAARLLALFAAGLPEGQLRAAGARAAGPSRDVCPECGHDPLERKTDPVCRVCPVCRVLAVVRAVSPDALERIADVVDLVGDALRAVAVRSRDSARPGERGERPGQRAGARPGQRTEERPDEPPGEPTPQPPSPEASRCECDHRSEPAGAQATRTAESGSRRAWTTHDSDDGDHGDHGDDGDYGGGDDYGDGGDHGNDGDGPG